MAVSKVVLLTVVLAVIVSTVTAQFGGLGGFGDLGFGFGKPFGKPGFGGGLGGFKPGLGGFGGKPGKPGSLLGGLGGLDLYRYHSPEDTVVPYYNWQNAPTNN